MDKTLFFSCCKNAPRPRNVALFSAVNIINEFCYKHGLRLPSWRRPVRRWFVWSSIPVSIFFFVQYCVLSAATDIKVISIQRGRRRVFEQSIGKTDEAKFVSCLFSVRSRGVGPLVLSPCVEGCCGYTKEQVPAFCSPVERLQAWIGDQNTCLLRV